MPTEVELQPKPPVVMCIEDNHETLDLIRLAMRSSRYALVTVADPFEGLQLALRQPPDLILLDLMMPDMSGWELLRQLRRHESTQSIPVVILTAKTGKVDRHYGEQVAKVDAYIVKPFEPQNLREIIRSVLVAHGKLSPE